MDGRSGSRVYQAVSEFSRQHNEERNDEAATTKFERLMLKALRGSQTATTWWSQAKYGSAPNWKVGKLVIIIDEIGKDPCLAHGLVDEVRNISCTINGRGLANKVMLVLVGTGLERLEYPYVEAKTLQGVLYRPSLASVGTDPSKSQVVVLKRPNLEDRATVFGVPTKDIMDGTYSQVLATNTRMLTRGVIPILKSRMTTLGVHDLSARRVALGSTNSVLDFAARVYIDTNDLLRRDPEQLEMFFLKQFRQLVFWELHEANARYQDTKVPIYNPAFEYLSNISEWFSYSEYEEVLKSGLITADKPKYL